MKSVVRNSKIQRLGGRETEKRLAFDMHLIPFLVKHVKKLKLGYFVPFAAHFSEHKNKLVQAFS